ncbi:hypothetical protein HYPGJ_30057 [Hyphomicrobium sp. GJ21]|nr:hypothetical protein HYPGJ_30057 [Hyphomicrobium sp. GJ21]
MQGASIVGRGRICIARIGDARRESRACYVRIRRDERQKRFIGIVDGHVSIRDAQECAHARLGGGAPASRNWAVITVRLRQSDLQVACELGARRRCRSWRFLRRSVGDDINRRCDRRCPNDRGHRHGFGCGRWDSVVRVYGEIINVKRTEGDCAEHDASCLGGIRIRQYGTHEIHDTHSRATPTGTGQYGTARRGGRASPTRYYFRGALAKATVATDANPSDGRGTGSTLPAGAAACDRLRLLAPRAERRSPSGARLFVLQMSICSRGRTCY